MANPFKKGKKTGTAKNGRLQVFPNGKSQSKPKPKPKEQKASPVKIIYRERNPKLTDTAKQAGYAVAGATAVNVIARPLMRFLPDGFRGNRLAGAGVKLAAATALSFAGDFALGKNTQQSASFAVGAFTAGFIDLANWLLNMFTRNVPKNGLALNGLQEVAQDEYGNVLMVSPDDQSWRMGDGSMADADYVYTVLSNVYGEDQVNEWWAAQAQYA
jgi:hypothetical protein